MEGKVEDVMEGEVLASNQLVASSSPFKLNPSTSSKYRVTSYTWPCDSGTLEKVTCTVYISTVAYTLQVTFYKVLETNCHIHLVGFYFILD